LCALTPKKENKEAKRMLLPPLLARAATALAAGRAAGALTATVRTSASVSAGARTAAEPAAVADERGGGRASSPPSTSTSTTSPAFSTLPIIDVRPLLDPAASPAAFNATAARLHAAARDVGFFYAAGLDGALGGGRVPGLLAAAAEWFARPAAAKARAALSPATHYRGWQPLGANVTRYGSGTGFVRDAHEGLDLYRELSPGGPMPPLRPSPLHSRNPWAAMDAPSLVADLKAHISDCLQLGQAITRGMAAGLGLPPAFFEGPGGGWTSAETSYWVTRLISYPPLPASARAAIEAAATNSTSGGDLPPDLALSCGAHCDYGMLTFVAADAPGLEVRNADGAWVAAPPIPDAVVCNTGDMWRLWSAGAYAPTLHRVVYRGVDGPRTSIAFFYEPAFGAVCRAPPGLPGADGFAGEEVEYGAHLEGKVLSNFEL
jgi:isopenicillin N synthase-like dioxygenase